MVAVHARGAIDELASVEPSAIIEYVALGEGRHKPWTDAERAGTRRSLGLADDRVVFGIFGGLTEEKRAAGLHAWLASPAGTRRRCCSLRAPPTRPETS
jgi:hypothetical protein